MFTEPYINFHELNLDWILAKVREWLETADNWEKWQRNVQDGFDALKRYVNNYFDRLDVQDEINNKLDEMLADGSLQEIINRATFYTSSELGWKVRKMADSYICSINKTETGITEAYLLTPDPPTNVAYCWYTNFISWMLPLPLKAATVISQPDAYFGTGINGYLDKYSTIKHRLLFFARDVPPTGNPVTVNTSINVMGERADVPLNPKYAVSANGLQAVAIAKSYYDARLNGRVYGYGPNFVTFGNSVVVNNAQGSAMMECDTLVALVMLGISYEDSPYSDDTPSYTYNFSDLVINPDNYGWTLPWAYNDIVGRKVTYTGAECWYYWMNDLVFSDITQLAPGDVVIFRRPEPAQSGSMFFDGIKHTGIIDIQTIDGVDVPYIYHITGAGATGSPMSYEPLQNVIQRENYDITKGEIYFARPNYDA